MKIKRMVSHIYVIEGKGSFDTYEDAKQAIARIKVMELLDHIGVGGLHDMDYTSIASNLGMFVLLYNEMEEMREEA